VARQRGIPRGRVQSPRRKTSWEAGTGGTAAGAVSASTATFVGSAVAPTVFGSTVVRIRGQLDLMLILATSAGDGFQGAFGIGIATTAAVVAGIASVPTPIAEQGSENWLFWHAVSIHNPIASSTAFTRSAFQRIIIDSKAMRKFEDPTMSLYAALELVEIGTATVNIQHDSRLLLMLA